MKKIIAFAASAVFAALLAVGTALPTSVKASEALLTTTPASSSSETSKHYEMWDAEKEKRFELRGIILNQDPTSLRFGLKDREFIEEFAASLGGTHITDYILCTGAGISMTARTETGTEYAELYEKKVAAGETPDSWSQTMYEHQVVKGLDYFEILTEEVPKYGVNCWISLRMNDSHYIQGTIDPNSTSLSTFYLENPQARRVLYTSKNIASYYNNSMSYASPEVREFHLKLINELLDKYDAYGFMLEWQRDMWLFPIGGEYNGTYTLNQFMRDVEALVSIYEEKYGHEIKIGVDVGSTLQTNYDFGLDIVSWAAEGIVDLVIPRSRWASTDINVPIRLWKTILEPYGVEVAGAIEQRMASGANASSFGNSHTNETMYGTAALIFSQGADKVYLYNHHPNINIKFKPEDKIADYSGGYNADENRWLKWTTLGSYDKLIQLDRKVVLGYNDMIPMWGGYGQAQHFPLEIRANQPGVFRMYVGDITEGSKVTLAFASIGTKEKNAPVVYINSQLCVFKSIEPNTENFSENDMFVYEVPESVYGDMYFVVEVLPNSKTPLIIDHAEVAIKTGKTILY